MRSRDGSEAHGCALDDAGDDVIDWFSIDWFNREDFTGPLTGGRPGQNTLPAHGRSRKFLDMAVAHHKPVMIAESSPSRYDLSDAAQAEAAWRQWFGSYFAMIAEHTEIKWFHLISYDWTRSSCYVQTGWKNNDFTASPSWKSSWRSCVSRSISTPAIRLY